MGSLRHFIVLLLFPLAFGVDFLVDPYNAQRVFVKTPVSARSLTEKRSGKDIHHHIQKRNADPASDSCNVNGLEGFESKLISNTHEVS